MKIKDATDKADEGLTSLTDIVTRKGWTRWVVLGVLILGLILAGIILVR